MLGYLQRQSPIFPPGTGYSYSNANYLLLGLIVQRITGSSLSEVIDARLLSPLGLRATHLGSAPGEAGLPGLVNSYDDLAGDGRLMNVSDLTTHSAAASLGYSGGDVGALSQVRRFPDLDATLVLLVNGGDGGVVAGLFKSLWNDTMKAALEGLPKTP